jgi:rubrerythrin
MTSAGATAREILEMAIRMEQRGHEFYEKAAQLVQMPGAKELLEELARDEVDHVRLFEGLQGRDDYEALAKGEIPPDLRLSDYLVSAPLTPESTPQDVLIHAMRFEQSAIDLYSAWASLYAGTDLEVLIEGLVAEERRHKGRLEAVYNDRFLEDW